MHSFVPSSILFSTAGEAIRAVVLSASLLPKIQRPDLTIQYNTLQAIQAIQYNLDSSRTVQREHLALLGWAGRLSGYSVRFGGLGGLGGVWELAIQYRGSIWCCWAGLRGSVGTL